ncbi:hypothetical protein Hanom_Chr15g01359391 [Helianthus anomalus]
MGRDTHTPHSPALGNFVSQNYGYSIVVVDKRVNFRFAPCGLVTLTVLLQTFKNSHFTP